MSERQEHSALAADEAARRRALALASFIVQAPAGAGKTELLTQRTLRLLAEVDQPEEVMAITFTNKAAAEMRERILGSLAIAVSGEMPDAPHKRTTFDLASQVLARDQAAGWQLLSHPGRLRITTIDALCLNLARQMPYLSRFGNQPGITDRAEEHYRQAARQTFNLLETDLPQAGEIGAALAFMDNDAGRLENLLVGMLGRRDQWLRHLGRMQGADFRGEVEAGFSLLYREILQAAADVLTPRWQSALMPLLRFAADQVPGTLGVLADWDSTLGSDPDDVVVWQALANVLLTSSGSLRQSFDKRVGFPADKSAKEMKAAMVALATELAQLEGLVPVLQAVQSLPSAKITDADWSTVESFVCLLQLATAQLWLVFQAAGEVDFIEIALRAQEALGDEGNPTDLAQALDYRIRHILVDEFQDTNPLQVNLLSALTRGWESGDGRTLFVVGDPMQSIYRFRKADVGTFLNVRDRGIGGIRLEPLILCRNNRSHPGVIDWVNRVFAALFPAKDAPSTGAVRYAEAVATKDAIADSRVQIHPVLVGQEDDADAAEAERILSLIQSERAVDPKQRIAVLVRARSHLGALVGAIRRCAPALRFQAVEIEGLLARQHVQDVLILQHALWHRADRVNWLALLRAPWCGLTLHDLHALAGDDHRSTIWVLMQAGDRVKTLSEDGQRRLQRVHGILAQAFDCRERQHPRRWLESVWVQLGGPACLESPADMADIDALFGLIDRLVAQGCFDAETLASEVADLYAPPDAQADETLQMMTIHKSKGLEFETVIVPGLQRQASGHEPGLLLWDEVNEADGLAHLLVAPMRQRGATVDGATTHDFLRRIEQTRSRHEDVRLLYVAATRAIRRLHLFGVAERARETGDVIAPRRGTFLELLWPLGAEAAFREIVGEPAQAAPAASFDSSHFVAKLRRLRHVSAAPVPDESGSIAAKPAARSVLPSETEAAFSLEISMGILVHRCLELMVGQGLERWAPETLPGRRPGFVRWLVDQGHVLSAAETGAERVLQALQTTLASEAGRWVVSAHAESGAEQAWSSREGDLTVNHVIDRVFIADGTRWIVDYKTVNLPADAALSLLEARAAEYRPQLTRYAGLFAGSDTPLKLAIFFPVQGRLVTLD